MPFHRAAAAACRPEPEAARNGAGMRVLLIEDDSATAQSIELMLKCESFYVYTTDLGEEGGDLGKLYDYDIILLDLNLPDMSGFEVLRSLRVSKVKTPILILTGLAGRGMARPTLKQCGAAAMCCASRTLTRRNPECLWHRTFHKT